jgi:hypothetical protein
MTVWRSWYVGSLGSASQLARLVPSPHAAVIRQDAEREFRRCGVEEFGLVLVVAGARARFT